MFENRKVYNGLTISDLREITLTAGDRAPSLVYQGLAEKLHRTEDSIKSIASVLRIFRRSKQAGVAHPDWLNYKAKWIFALSSEELAYVLDLEEEPATTSNGEQNSILDELKAINQKLDELMQLWK